MKASSQKLGAPTAGFSVTNAALDVNPTLSSRRGLGQHWV
jgi:hypothetical protein